MIHHKKHLISSILLATAYSVYAQGNIEETIIVANKVEIPIKYVGSSVSTLDRDEIQSIGYTNLTDTLRSLPSIAVSNNGGLGKQTALRIRGEESYRTQIFIDGLKISDPTGTQVGPSVNDLLSSNINRVEVIRGPQGLIYGADAGGVINITTVEPDSAIDGSIAFETGRYSTNSVSGFVGSKNERWTYSLNAAKVQTDGFNSRSDDTSLETDGYENLSIHAKATYQPTDASNIQLVFRNVIAENEYDRCSTPRSEDCQNDTDQFYFRIAGNYQSGIFNHQLSYANTDIERDSGVASMPSFNTEGTIDRLEYLGNVNLESNGLIVYGIEFEKEDVTADSGDEFDREQISLYGEYQKNIDQWYFSAGVRSDDNEDFGQFTNFRLSTAYLINLQNDWELKLKGSFGSGFRAPSISELAYNSGPFASGDATTIILEQENSLGYDFGAELLLDNGAKFELVYFNQRINDEIFFDLIGFSGYLQQDGESNSNGLEFYTEFPISPKVRFKGNFTINDAQQSDGNTDRIRRPDFIANASLDYQANDALSMYLSYRTATDSEDSNNVALDDYFVIDFNIAYQITDKLAVSGKIKNLTDEDYQEITNFNTSGSAASFSVQYDF